MIGEDGGHGMEPWKLARAEVIIDVTERNNIYCETSTSAGQTPFKLKNQLYIP